MADDKLKDGPHNYYTANSTVPIVCEICAGHVWEVGDQHMRPLSHYGGKFVRLVEVDDDQQEQNASGAKD